MRPSREMIETLKQQFMADAENLHRDNTFAAYALDDIFNNPSADRSAVESKWREAQALVEDYNTKLKAFEDKYNKVGLPKEGTESLLHEYAILNEHRNVLQDMLADKREEIDTKYPPQEEADDVAQWNEFDKVHREVDSHDSNAFARIALFKESLDALSKDPHNNKLLNETMALYDKAKKHMLRYAESYFDFENRLKIPTVAEYVEDTHRQSGLNSTKERFEETRQSFLSAATEFISIVNKKTEDKKSQQYENTEAQTAEWRAFDNIHRKVDDEATEVQVRLSLLNESVEKLKKDPSNDELFQDVIKRSRNLEKHMVRYNESYQEFERMLKIPNVAEYVEDTHRQGGVASTKENQILIVRDYYKWTLHEFPRLLYEGNPSKSSQQVEAPKVETPPMTFVQRMIAFWNNLVSGHKAAQEAGQVNKSPAVKQPIKVVEASHPKDDAEQAERVRQSAIAGRAITGELRREPAPVVSSADTVVRNVVSKGR